MFSCCSPHLLGFNLSNLNEKIPFFHRARFLKKLLVAALLFVIGGAVIIALGSLYSDAYRLAHNLAAS